MRRMRFVAWGVCVTSALAGTATWLSLLRGTRIVQNDAALIGGWATLGAILVVVALLLKTSPADAIRLSAGQIAWTIVVGALTLQVLALLWLAPALSEDVLRYRLDGRMWLRGLSPYAHTPDQYVWTRGLDLDQVDLSVPHDELHTIYPPTAQLFFVASRRLDDVMLPREGLMMHFSPWQITAPHLPKMRQALLLRLAFAAAALGCVITLLSILSRQQSSPWYAVLLGWNPLVVIETGGMGHVDVVGGLFVLLTIRALRTRRPILAAAMLALAAGVKPH